MSTGNDQREEIGEGADVEAAGGSAKKTLVKLWDKTADAWIALVALGGALAVGYVLYGNGVHGFRSVEAPTDPATGEAAQAARAPEPFSMRRRGSTLGDVQFRRGQLFFREGRRTGTPNMLDSEDQKRLDQILQASRDPRAREAMGITQEQLQQVRDTRRGQTLNVPESEIQRIGNIRDRVEREIAIAQAVAAARDDFLDRTDKALSTLRKIIPNPQ